jgi:hypothetical protein
VGRNKKDYSKYIEMVRKLKPGQAIEFVTAYPRGLASKLYSCDIYPGNFYLTVNSISVVVTKYPVPKVVTIK